MEYPLKHPNGLSNTNYVIRREPFNGAPAGWHELHLRGEYLFGAMDKDLLRRLAKRHLELVGGGTPERDIDSAMLLYQGSAPPTTGLALDEMQTVVNAITYKPGWTVSLHVDSGEPPRPYLQVAATTPCWISLEPTPWKSGKTYLSPHMCRQEIVGAAYSAIEKAELHEVREFFRYKGASIFNPHLDPDKLAELANKKDSFCMRANAMTMQESEQKK